MKKRYVVIVVVAILLVCAAVFIKIQLNVNQAIEEQDNIIQNCCAGFESADRSGKVEIYNNLQAKYVAYKQDEKALPKVIKKYEQKVSELKTLLLAYYDEQITENTIADIDENNDKEVIQKAKNNLVALLGVVKSENIAVADYEGKINEMINSYGKRINEIEKEEKRLLAENAAKAKTAYRQYFNKLLAEYGGAMSLYDFVCDIDKDGISELIVQFYVAEGDNTFSVYTYKNGSVSKVGDLDRNINKLCINSRNHKLIAHSYRYLDASDPQNDKHYTIGISNGKLTRKEFKDLPAYDGLHFSYCNPLS